MAFSLDRLPAKAREAHALGALAWPAVVQYAANAGLYDIDYLTNVVYFMHRPERNGKAIDPTSEPGEANLWKSFRTGVAAIASEIKSAARRAVIIVPGQGENAKHFVGTARRLDREVYAGRAVIVKTTLSDASPIGVELTRTSGSAFSWSSVRGLRTVMVVSHAGPCDGPNLNSGTPGGQPWGAAAGTACTDQARLTTAGAAFWKAAGQALRPDGKVILLGCHMGESNYATLVAKATGKSVYAAINSFAAANGASAEKHVMKIESGNETNTFKVFK